jgi:hypothetical protein
MSSSYEIVKKCYWKVEKKCCSRNYSVGKGEYGRAGIEK